MGVAGETKVDLRIPIGLLVWVILMVSSISVDHLAKSSWLESLKRHTRYNTPTLWLCICCSHAQHTFRSLWYNSDTLDLFSILVFQNRSNIAADGISSSRAQFQLPFNKLVLLSLTRWTDFVQTRKGCMAFFGPNILAKPRLDRTG